MPTINPGEGAVQIGIEDSPFTNTLGQVTVVLSADVTDAEAEDLADRIAASDYATTRLTNTPVALSVVVSRPTQVRP